MLLRYIVQFHSSMVFALILRFYLMFYVLLNMNYIHLRKADDGIVASCHSYGVVWALADQRCACWCSPLHCQWH